MSDLMLQAGIDTTGAKRSISELREFAQKELGAAFSVKGGGASKLMDQLRSLDQGIQALTSSVDKAKSAFADMDKVQKAYAASAKSAAEVAQKSLKETAAATKQVANSEIADSRRVAQARIKDIRDTFAFLRAQAKEAARLRVSFGADGKIEGPNRGQINSYNAVARAASNLADQIRLSKAEGRGMEEALAGGLKAVRNALAVADQDTESFNVALQKMKNTMKDAASELRAFQASYATNSTRNPIDQALKSQESGFQKLRDSLRGVYSELERINAAAAKKGLRGFGIPDAVLEAETSMSKLYAAVKSGTALTGAEYVKLRDAAMSSLKTAREALKDYKQNVEVAAKVTNQLSPSLQSAQRVLEGLKNASTFERGLFSTSGTAKLIQAGKAVEKMTEEAKRATPAYESLARVLDKLNNAQKSGGKSPFFADSNPGKILTANAALDKMKGSLEGVSSGHNRLHTMHQKTMLGLSSLQRFVFNTQVALSGLAAAFGFREILQANINLETFTNTLRAVSGDMQTFSANMNFLLQKADEVGVSMTAIGNPFARFTTAAKNGGFAAEEVKTAFEQLVVASRNFGLTAADTQGVIRALEQSLSKGKFMAEEVRLQLGDRIPIAMTALQKATGASAEELNKMFESGSLYTEKYFVPFVKALYEMSGGQAALSRSSRSLVAEVERLSNAFLMASGVAGENGFSTAVKSASRSLTEFLNSAAGQDVAASFGAAIAVVTDAIILASEAVSGFIENWEIFLSLGVVAGIAAVTSGLVTFNGVMAAMGAFALANPFLTLAAGVGALATAFAVLHGSTNAARNMLVSLDNTYMSLDRTQQEVASTMEDYDRIQRSAQNGSIAGIELNTQYAQTLQQIGLNADQAKDRLEVLAAQQASMGLDKVKADYAEFTEQFRDAQMQLQNRLGNLSRDLIPNAFSDSSLNSGALKDLISDLNSIAYIDVGDSAEAMDKVSKAFAAFYLVADDAKTRKVGDALRSDITKIISAVGSAETLQGQIQQIEGLQSAISLVGIEYARMFKKADDALNVLSSGGIDSLREKFGWTAEDVKLVRDELNELVRTGGDISHIVDIVASLTGQMDKAATAAKAIGMAADDFNKIVESLRKTQSGMGGANTEALEFQRSLVGMTEIQRQTAEAIFSGTSALRKYEEAMKKGDKAGMESAAAALNTAAIAEASAARRAAMAAAEAEMQEKISQGVIATGEAYAFLASVGDAAYTKTLTTSLELYKAIISDFKVETVETTNKVGEFIESLKAENSEILRNIAVASASTEAQKAVAQQIAIENALRDQKVSALSAEGQQIAELVAANLRLKDAQEAVEDAKAYIKTAEEIGLPESIRFTNEYEKVLKALEKAVQDNIVSEEALAQARAAGSKILTDLKNQEEERRQSMRSDLEINVLRLQGYEDQAEALERLNKQEETYKQAIEAGFDESTARGMAKRLYDAETAAAALRKEVEGPTYKAFQKLATEVDKNLTDAFKNMFKEGEFSFKSMVDGMLDMFLDMLAEMAYQAAIKPIVVGVAQQVGSSVFGLSQNATNSALGVEGSSTFGLGNLSSIGNLFSGSSSLYNIGSSIATSGFGQTIGMSTLQSGAAHSLGVAAVPGGLSNAAGTPVMTGFGSTFAEGLSASPWGIVGSIGANLLFDDLNPVGSTIGGMVGSIGGGMAGSALLGTILGSAGGPVGAILGSFLGTTLGGMIGGGKPHPGASYEAVIGTGGKLGSPDVRSKHMDSEGVRQMGSALEQYTMSLSKTLGEGVKLIGNVGATIDETAGRTAFLTRGGAATGLESMIRDDGVRFYDFDPKDEKSQNRAITRLTLDLAKNAEGLSEMTKRVVDNLVTAAKANEDLASSSVESALYLAENWEDVIKQMSTGVVDLRSAIVDEAVSAIDQMVSQVKTFQETVELAFGKGSAEVSQSNEALKEAVAIFAGLRDNAPAMTAIEAQMAQLNARYGELPRLFEAVGYSAVEAAELAEQAYQKTVSKLRQNVNQNIALEIVKMVDPAQAAVFEAYQRLTEMRRDVIATGGDIALFQQYEKLVLARAAEDEAIKDQIDELESSVDAYDKVARSLKEFRKSLILDQNLTTLDPFAQLSEAEKQFNEVADKAKAGDVTAMEALPGVSQAYLEIAKNYFASTEEYAKIFNKVNLTLEDTETLAERQMRVAQDQLTALNTSVLTQKAMLDALLVLGKPIAESVVGNAAVTVGTDNMGRALGEWQDPADSSNNLFRGEWQSIARNLGYTGDFGGGGHNAWLAADPTRMSAWNNAIAEAQAAAAWRSQHREGVPQNLHAAANIALKQQLGYTGAFGHGGFDAWIVGQDAATKSKASDILNKYGQSYRVTWTMPGYADGGMIGNGMWNIDSVIARYGNGGAVALAGGEYVVNATAVTPDTLPMMQYINANGTLPANDDDDAFKQQMLSELKAVRQAIILVGGQQIEVSEEGNKYLAAQTSAVERKMAAPR